MAIQGARDPAPPRFDEIKDVREVEAEPGQMREAIDQVMKASGFNLPNRVAPAQQPGQGVP